MEDLCTVSLHLIILGTLMLGFTMFLAGLVLSTALLFLAGAARLLGTARLRALPPGGSQAPATSPREGPDQAEAEARMNSAQCPLHFGIRV